MSEEPKMKLRTSEVSKGNRSKAQKSFPGQGEGTGEPDEEDLDSNRNLPLFDHRPDIGRYLNVEDRRGIDPPI